MKRHFLFQARSLSLTNRNEAKRAPLPFMGKKRGARSAALAALLALGLPLAAAAQHPLSCPGLAPSSVDDQGRLVEDWGVLGLKLGQEPPAKAVVQSLKLDGVIPAVEVRSDYPSVTLRAIVYRAPAFPAGLDVLTVSFLSKTPAETTVPFSLVLPGNVQLGLNTVSVGGRPVVALPSRSKMSQKTREWGWADDAVALPGWARPSTECDPAFKNIRAGLGGVPLQYHFKVEPKSSVEVVLGFCESHWSSAGQRPVLCSVEGAPLMEVDPIARWGQHVPGAVRFAARDQNGDGTLDLSILPKPGAPDENPILNAIWLFKPGRTGGTPPGAGAPDTLPDLAQIIAGRANDRALQYVDVGGPNDQSLYAGGTVEYQVKLAPGATNELTFLVACAGASAPRPDRSTWTAPKLRKAAAQVWREWKE